MAFFSNLASNPDLARILPPSRAPTLVGGPAGGMGQDHMMLVAQVHQMLQELMATDPQRFHVIAKQFGIGPYASLQPGAGQGIGPTNEFPKAGTPAAGGY